MKKHVYIFVFFFLFLLSCSQLLDINFYSNHDTELLLNKIYADGKLLNEYVYDVNNNLIMLKVFDEDSVIHTESYSYNSFNQLENRFYDGFVETYDYDKYGRLTKFTKYYAKTDKTWEEVYIYNLKGQIAEGITFYNGAKRGYISYKYDQNGNTTEREEYDSINNLISAEYRFTYDNKESPFILNFPRDIVQNNNIVKYYYYLVIMSYPPPQYESTFEYNSVGLPVKETRIYSSIGKPVIYEYVY